MSMFQSFEELKSSWTKRFGSHTFYLRKNLQVKIKMIKELLLIIVGVAVADAAVCRITTCLTFICGETNCPPGFRVKYRGGFCGCCDNCVEALNKGDTCNPDIRIGGEGDHKGVTNSHPMCDYGLKCDENSKTCVEDENSGSYNQTSSSS
ncbi:uncharacterized protein TNCT_129481 [Trichonephila clavata]|uniref:IGFBP N-terminal domain-containing protein n=1 Tax=Trichonephila clavata TaxID=2740835 RepID=A0A8X6LWG0_TRICU|nr:uncharacterized protein TNCT_129481 [Trichonephila clavata]